MQLQRMTRLREQLKELLGDEYNRTASAPTPGQIERGAELYPQICGGCHGGRGDGNGKVAEGLMGRPTDLTDPAQANFFSDAARLYIIRKRIAETTMMGWEEVLTEQDLEAVLHYILSLKQTE